MMGFSDVLSGLKNKVLDAATYELLSRNFELLEDNNSQLKDKVEFQKEEIEKLKTDNHRLMGKLGELQAELDVLQKDDLQFNQKLGIFTSPQTSFSYCPSCYRSSPSKKVELQVMSHGWQCHSCGNFISNPNYDRPTHTDNGYNLL